MTRKRPRYEQDASEYLPCEFCSDAFKRKWLSLPQTKCAEIHGRERQRRVQSTAKIMIPESSNSEEISEILRVRVL